MEEDSLLIDLKENGGTFRFYTIEDINKWLQAERNYWQYLAESVNIQPAASTALAILSQYKNNFRIIQDIVHRIENNKDNAALIASERENLKRTVETIYHSEQILHSYSVKAKFIAQLRDKTPIESVSALASFHHIEIGFNDTNSQVVKGTLEALLFQKGLQSNEMEQLALQETKHRYDSLLDEHSETARGLKIDYENTKKEISELKSQFTQDAKTSLDGTRSDAESLLNSAKKDFESLHATYNQHMALEAPVTYWEMKAAEHKVMSRWFGGIALLFLLAGLIGFLWSPDWLPTSGDDKFILSGISIWHVSKLLLFTSLYIWILRILIRNYLSHVHLKVDADERVVMAKTFLAMIKDNQAIKAEDRQLVLNSLFRHTSSGIIKDDAMPPIFEIINKLGESKK